MGGRRVRRRDLIFLVGAGVVVWPVVGRAQQPKVWQVGYLHPGFWDSSGDGPLFESFRKQLSDLGYIEGMNLVIEKRAAEGRYERLPALAADLVARRPDVIVAVAIPAIAAAQKATATIPIIMTPAADPIGFGFVKSFSHPGGNITGLANMFDETITKCLELLHAIIPYAKRIGVLMSSNPTHKPVYKVAEAAAELINLTTVPIVATAPSDLPIAFEEISRAHCDVVFVLADPIRPDIVALANLFRIPAFYQFREFVEAGGLASYGASLRAMFRRSAQYVDKILKGAIPADLPVEQPTTFEFILNTTTAKTLGLTVPPTLLAQADEVIE